MLIIRALRRIVFPLAPDPVAHRPAASEPITDSRILWRHQYANLGKIMRDGTRDTHLKRIYHPGKRGRVLTDAASLRRLLFGYLWFRQIWFINIRYIP
ncbi:hypothetical protein GWI33_015205 [Rhynchophorus ferrugineus]|uniref:Uncharacterized protein n=1 Tax=Rhynchophorus ferrugineus TaxID=354439 RepID=A0A834I301_RHYFE|nr:hypothetical protein GWI33_015205 [Rhynchophorus ferrugineus]